jgi:hypothetical protein
MVARVSSEVATLIALESEEVRAELLPLQGGRVRSLYDRVGERELLYARSGVLWNPGDYLATLVGGWDQMFPNDDPWDGLPTHGVLWSTELEVESVSAAETVLRCELDRPSATVSHRYSLLPPPRRGLRLDTVVEVGEALPACLWATHPMLAVAPGWRVDAGAGILEADAVDPGRGVPDGILTVPPPSQGWQEVLYAPAGGAAGVLDPGSGVGTTVRWDAEFFRWLWVVTLSGFEGVDLAVVLEPCTSRPYRLDEAMVAGTAQELQPGIAYRFWSSVEATGPR